MSAQSLSIVVPNKCCVNDCAFCVSKMHCTDTVNMMDDSNKLFDLYLNDYLDRLEYCRDDKVDTIMLTGSSEPQQNRKFLTYFGLLMQLMKNPFHKIEMQTTGVLIDRNYLRFLRNHVGVNTIALSLSSFSNEKNREYNGTPIDLKVDIDQLCRDIKEYDFNLRLCLNMTDGFNWYDIDSIFSTAKALGANQITFRMLYSSYNNTPQDDWIFVHGAKPSAATSIKEYILEHGTELGTLPYGAKKYSVHGMSTVVDTDCMNKENKEENKYYILRPDCKLYSQWDDPASLIF